MNRKDKILMDRSWEALRAQLDREMPAPPPLVAPRSMMHWHVAAVAAGIAGLFLLYSLRQISTDGAAPGSRTLPHGQQQVAAPLAPATAPSVADASPIYADSKDKIATAQSQNLSKSVGNQTASSTKQATAAYGQSGPTSRKSSLKATPQRSQIATRIEATTAQSHVASQYVQVAQTSVNQSVAIDLPTAQTQPATVPENVNQGLVTNQTQGVQIETSPQQPTGNKPLTATGATVASITLLDQATFLPVASIAPNTPPVVTAPVVTAARVPLRWSYGVQGAIGASLLPVPSSGSLALSVRRKLGNSSYALTGAVGADQIHFGKRAVVLVELDADQLDAANLDADITNFLTNRASQRQFPNLRSALYGTAQVGIQKYFSTRWLTGAAVKYQRFIQARLSDDQIMKSFQGVNPSGYDPALAEALDNAYEKIASNVYAPHSLSLQLSLQYALSRRLSLGIMSQNVLTNKHPEPISLHVSAVYHPFGK